MSETTWQEIRSAAAAIGDMRSELLRRTGWPPETLEQETSRIQGSCDLSDPSEAMRALLEIVLMREHFEISEALDPPMQLRLVETMWLRSWTGDELRAGLADVIRRFHLIPATIATGIEALLGIGHRFRRMKQPDRWPKRAAQDRCAELMWLTGQSEDAVFKSAHEALDRFELGRGGEEQALAALQEIELVYRETSFDPALPEAQRHVLAEIMWLRAWSLQQTLEQAVALRNNLGLSGAEQPIDSLHQICLRCGGPVVPNLVTEAVDALLHDVAAPHEQREFVRTEFGEFRWLRQYNVAQALDRVRRYGSMTGDSLLDVFHAVLEAARESFRERQGEQDKEKP